MSSAKSDLMVEITPRVELPQRGDYTTALNAGLKIGGFKKVSQVHATRPPIMWSVFSGYPALTFQLIPRATSPLPTVFVLTSSDRRAVRERYTVDCWDSGHYSGSPEYCALALQKVTIKEASCVACLIPTRAI